MGQWIKQNTEDVYGSENSLYDTIKTDTYYKFVQTHRMYNTKHFLGKLWTLGDYDVLVQIHQLNQCTILVVSFIMGEVVHM